MEETDSSMEGISRAFRGTSLQGLGPKKKPSRMDPLIGHGRHFGRTIHAFCHIHSLLLAGLQWMGSDEEEDHTAEEQREHRVFQSLLATVPGLADRITDEQATEQDIRHIADLLQKGAGSARSDDTKSLKSAIIDWLTPRDQPLIPPLARNVKIDRGFNHEVTGRLLCPAGLDWSDPEVKDKLRNGLYIVPGDQWPVFLWKDFKYNPDNPWNGFLKSKLLISTYKHIFTSPSSVDQPPKATRAGNARLHGMTKVNKPSLAYVATQARFALSAASVFTRTDTETDSVRFYNSLLGFLQDPEEQEDVAQLLLFWNQLIFPGSSSAKLPITKNSALAELKRQRERRRLQSITLNNQSTT